MDKSKTDTIKEEAVEETPVVEEIAEAPQEEAVEVRSFNVCHECDESGLVGTPGQETLCPKCLGKGKLG